MGILDGLFSPNKNTTRGFGNAINDLTQTREVTDPFYTGQINSGANARTRLEDLLFLNGQGAANTAIDQFQTSPGYQFQMDQGRAAIDQSAIARGGLNSGSTVKALTQYGQGLANQEYQQYLSNLGGIANQGAQGASGLLGTSQAAGNLQIGFGQSKDQGNQAAAGNILGIAGTLTGYGSGGGFGGGTFGRLFGGGGSPYALPSVAPTGFNQSNLY